MKRETTLDTSSVPRSFRRPWTVTHIDGRTLTVDAFTLVGARIMAASAWGCGTSRVRSQAVLTQVAA